MNADVAAEAIDAWTKTYLQSYVREGALLLGGGVGLALLFAAGDDVVGLLRTEAHRVLGCISAVWLTAELRPDGSLAFHADADSPLVRGLVVGLADFFSGATPAEIAASDADPLATLELLANLSPTRRNGLTAVRQRIRTLAQSHLA